MAHVCRGTVGIPAVHAVHGTVFYFVSLPRRAQNRQHAGRLLPWRRGLRPAPLPGYQDPSRPAASCRLGHCLNGGGFNNSRRVWIPWKRPAALLPIPPPRQEPRGVAGGAHACRRPPAAVVTPADQDSCAQRLPPRPHQQKPACLPKHPSENSRTTLSPLPPPREEKFHVTLKTCTLSQTFVLAILPTFPHVTRGSLFCRSNRTEAVSELGVPVVGGGTRGTEGPPSAAPRVNRTREPDTRRGPG